MEILSQFSERITHINEVISSSEILSATDMRIEELYNLASHSLSKTVDAALVVEMETLQLLRQSLAYIDRIQYI
jgi:hypothetical protein